MKKELQVAALDNGTVIDHIPNNKLFEVVRILHLEKCPESSIIVGFNLDSKKMGHKSLIKVRNHFFTDAELNQLSIVSPNFTLCIIKNYEVVEKKTIELPEVIKNIVKCPNPKCITNNEPMSTLFTISDENKGILQCHYCEKEINVEDVKFT